MINKQQNSLTGYIAILFMFFFVSELRMSVIATNLCNTFENGISTVVIIRSVIILLLQLYDTHFS